MIKSARIESIDLLRGIVMILMALDHVRDYFHADVFLYDPLDLSQTNVPLYFTRWITHFCAPVFVFLAGTSAYITSTRKTKAELSMFLLKRGLWLIFLELTVINFAWFFNIEFSLLTLFVIWALGVAMIVLSVCIHLPWKVILSIGIVLIAGHNLLDDVHVEGDNLLAIFWSMLHDPGYFQLSENTGLFIGYAVIPWIGVMLAGYCFGILYQYEYNVRRKVLLSLSISMITLFIVLRLINLYGDPEPWIMQPNITYTILSFLNVTKYPPSLLYVLITLGIAILFLAFAEMRSSHITKMIIVLGRVPMFYYLLHIFLIHAFAMLAAVLTGFAPGAMVFTTWVSRSAALVGYGFSLPFVYLVWIVVVVTLYPLCRWYETYKSNHRDQWWLSYL